jgi:hypothetical protein
VFVFNDNAWTNGAPDTEEAGLQGFTVNLREQTDSLVSDDYHNRPLCGGQCTTDTAGFVQINDLSVATYFIEVHPPDGPCNSNPDSQWYQTTTIDGGLQLQAGVEEGSDGTGAPGEQLWEPPNVRTSYWFGFVCSPMDFAQQNGTGEITGTARNWQGWPPFDVLTMGDPVENPFVALSDSTTDRVVYVGRGDGAGNFDIQHVPPGSYNLAVWDEQLNYILRFKPVTIGPGQTVDTNDAADVKGEVGLGVSRWFGWLDGYVYKDKNQNGIRDPGEPGIGNTDMDQRWRDGSIKEATFTDPSGYYSYPTAEGGALGKWIINEQGFARFGVSGASVHDEYNPDQVTPIPTDLGGALLTNQLLTEGHRATVDWGKYDYAPNTPGQIVGITYFATTRNEFIAKNSVHEDYEAAIPDVTVYLEGLGPDGQPNTADDTIVNAYVTDHWQHPNGTPPSGSAFAPGCSVRDAFGTDISALMNPAIGPSCLEVPITGEQTKDGAFDGGYAFDSYCPDGLKLGMDNLPVDPLTCNDNSSPDDHPLVAGTYITHAVMPKDATDTRDCNPANPDGHKAVSDAHGIIPGGGTGCLYRPEREEDVNVDLGNQFQPIIPPPDCTGDDHVLDQSTLTSRSPYFGDPTAHAPLCDKRLVVLQNGQNANADFHLMTNFDNGIDVEEPGRIIGLVSNDIYFERNAASVWYGEPRPIAGIPVGIYQRVDTVPNINQPYDANNWRLMTTVYTSPEGTYEALLPSTENFNCPIPQGPCPGMYLFKVDDPGTKANPNPGYDPNLLTATSVFDVWPGTTDQLDTPLDPISGTGCEDPAVPARPDILQVGATNPAAAGAPVGPVVRAAGITAAARRLTIQADFLSPTPGTVTLTDPRAGQSRTLGPAINPNPTLANGGIVSWTAGVLGQPDTIVIQVPVVQGNFLPGQKQLTITNSAASGGLRTVNGITVHVLGTFGGNQYLPPIVQVPPPAFTGPNAHAIQNTIDAPTTAAGSLLVLSPGTYNENVVLWKPLKLQGIGPGGIIGAHEFQARDAEDPRFSVLGSVIDGRFFAQNATAYDATVAAHAPYAGVDATHPVLRGADVTLLAQTAAAYNIPGGVTGVFSAARVDGIGFATGRGDGAGGIQLQANANNSQLTNDVLENNGGIFAGGIGIGQPYDHTSHNFNVRMANDRLMGNGGLTRSGGIGIFYGSNTYEVANSIVCANFGVEYGAGISHWGLSPGGSIHDNQIYYNEAVDSGAGISIQTELPVGGGLGDGSGSVDVDRNLIQSNYSGDDGGGIFVLDALTAPINVRNNMIVDNGSSDLGGGIMLDDASNVSIINNTVANNVTTASNESSAIGVPHGAGLASEANDPLFQAILPAGAPDFSNPVALFNNIFWDNDAMTLDSFGPGATLVDQGFIDFEVHGTTNNADTFTPRYSNLTNGQILGPDGIQRAVPAGQGNIIGVDPGFVTPFTLELTVSGARLDPQQAAVTITGADPPVGLTGDYHIVRPLTPATLLASGVVDRGSRCALTPFPAPGNALNPCASTNRGAEAPRVDFDGDVRPRRGTLLRPRLPWDLGADELSAGGAIVPLP